MELKKRLIKCIILSLLLWSIAPSFQTDAQSPLSASKEFQGVINKIFSSSHNTLVLKDDGTLWAWGTNTHGQLGTNDFNDSFLPTQIMHLDDQGVEQELIAIDIAIRENIYGRTFLAVDSTGNVWAWGSNYSEVIDNNRSLNDLIPYPQKVNGLLEIIAIAAGKDHILALDKEGFVWSWGQNMNGPLGRGHKDNRQSTPGKVLTTSEVELSGIKAIATSEMHSLALHEDGTVYSWGHNNKGQQGDGTTAVRYRASAIAGLPNIQTIVTAHSSFASANSFNFAQSVTGSVYGWGDNTYGQLGTGTTDAELSPMEIPELFGALQISTGLQHTLVLKSDGTVWAAGRLLQIDDWENKTTMFTRISNLEDIKGISAGPHQNFALKSDGSVVSWGTNPSGVLGYGYEGDFVIDAQPILELKYYDVGPKPMENIVMDWGHDYGDDYVDITFSLPFPLMYSSIGFEIYKLGDKSKGEPRVDYSYVFSGNPNEVRLYVDTEATEVYELYIYINQGDDTYDGDLYIIAKPDTFTAGNGTSIDDPWIIKTPEQLNEIRNYGVSQHAKTYFKLGADIDLTSYLAEDGTGYEQWGDLGWEPIGVENLPFTGVFDGNDFMITGLYNDRVGANRLDLFGFVEDDNNIVNLRIASTEAGLSTVSLSEGTLTSSSPQHYEASLSYEVDELSVIAELIDSNATLVFEIGGNTIGGHVLGAVITSDAIPLIVGDNTLELLVTAGDGKTKQAYSIHITREAEKQSPVIPDDSDGDDENDGGSGSGGKGDNDDENNGEDENNKENDEEDNGNNSDHNDNNVDSGNDTPAVNEQDDEKNAVHEEASVNLIDIAGHWAEKDIRSLVLLGGIKGYHDDTFRPDSNITRAEFLSIIVNTLSLQQTGEAPFLDITNHWARHIITAAYTNSIINGYSELKFGPDDLLTREQMVSVIVKVFSIKQLESDFIFSDDSSISSWARKQMETAISHRIITGFTDRTIRAKAYTTRAEAATVVMRALSLE